MLVELIADLDHDNHPLAFEIARIPEDIRGFGAVKANRIAVSRVKQAELLTRFRGRQAQPSAAIGCWEGREAPAKYDKIGVPPRAVAGWRAAAVRVTAAKRIGGMEIAVIGGGNGAYAAAADLSEQGHRVRLWRRDEVAFAPVLERQTLTLTDVRGSREVAIALASTSIDAVTDGAELVLVPLPATAQASVAEALAPRLEDGQVVFLPPGTFGSYVMARRVRDLGKGVNVCFAEAGTLPYLARKRGPAEVAITARATRLPAGVFPAEAQARAFAVLTASYPAVERLTDALDGALMNAGPVIHPPLILMNAGPLEHFERWDIHNEGTQPAIRKVTDALDSERIAVREALGYGAPHFPLADHYDPEGEEWMYGNAAHERLADSGDWCEHIDLDRHRYMREDVAQGLAFLVSVADWAGVACPLARSLLAIASAILGEDLRATGRTLENLGLAGLSRDEMKALLVRGIVS